MLSKILSVCYSFLIFQKIVPDGVEHKINKLYDRNLHDIVWQVVEYSKYDLTRVKYLNGIPYETGLSFTINFFRKAPSNIYKILIISSDSLPTDYSEDVLSHFDRIVFVKNCGLDLGAHKQCFKLLKYFYQDLPQSTSLIISNSSFKPKSLCNILKLTSIAQLGNNLIGVSYCYGPRYFFLKKLHLQSFFLISNFKNLYAIFDNLNFDTNNKLSIIRNGEIKISDLALNFGLNLVSYDGSYFNIWAERSRRFFFYDSRLKDSSIENINTL